MKTNYFKMLIVGLITTITTAVSGQDYFIDVNNPNSLKLFNGINEYRTWSIGISGGSLMPISSFGGKNDFSNWQSNFGYGLNVTKQISHVFGFKADFIGGKISANNERLWNGITPEGPYKSFKTDIHWTASFNVVATLSNINWSKARTFVKPYISAGVGAINFSPHLVYLNNTNYDPEGNKTNFFIPLEIGAKIHLNQNLNLVTGYTVGILDGDNLDGFYKPPYLNDHFSFAHIGIEFSLGNKNKPQLARFNPPRQLHKYTNDNYMDLREQVLILNDRIDQKNNQITILSKDILLLKMDTDGDGVNDYFDKCPNTSKGVKVDGSGCILPQPTLSNDQNTMDQFDNRNSFISQGDLTVMYDASRHLEFETGKSTLKSESIPYLHRIVDILMRKALNIKINGYTDNVGSDEMNLNLSKARAKAVKDYLIQNGIHGDHIFTEGYGSKYPIASNMTKLGRKKNRRVEFIVYGTSNN